MTTIPTDVLKHLPTCKHYVSRDIKGNIVQANTLVDGKWVDTTQKEREIEQAQRELAKAKKILAKEVSNETT